MPAREARWMACAMRSSMIVFLLAGSKAHAADRFFVYDMTTASTFTGVYLAKPGTQAWGPNQALNDKDKSVDPSERLRLTGIERGVYDLKLIDEKGRTCIKRGVDLTKETTYEIRDADLDDCK